MPKVHKYAKIVRLPIRLPLTYIKHQIIDLKRFIKLPYRSATPIWRRTSLH